MKQITKNWDFYFCNIDGKPASIYVDLDGIEVSPIRTHPNASYLHLKMRNPRPDGMSSNEESERLLEIEAALESMGGDDMIYIGRYTSDGHRTFCLYTEEQLNWEAQARALMRAYPEYTFDTRTQQDPEWSTYSSFLYPNKKALQFIKNQHVREALEKKGDSCELVRVIDHWITFSGKSDAAKFFEESTQLGFTICDDAVRYARLSREDKPADIDNITYTLIDLACKYDGEYDGWGCEVTSESNRP